MENEYSPDIMKPYRVIQYMKFQEIVFILKANENEIKIYSYWKIYVGS